MKKLIAGLIGFLMAGTCFARGGITEYEYLIAEILRYWRDTRKHG